MIFSAESAGAEGSDFDDGNAVCFGGTVRGFIGSAEVVGSFATLPIARGAWSPADETVKRPIPTPMSSAVTAMAIGSAKRCMESV
jgi:hypothetical protein